MTRRLSTSRVKPGRENVNRGDLQHLRRRVKRRVLSERPNGSLAVVEISTFTTVASSELGGSEYGHDARYIDQFSSTSA